MSGPALSSTSSGGLSALYQLIRSKKDKTPKPPKDSASRQDKDLGVASSSSSSSSSLWSRANSLRQSLRHRRHAHPTSISVLIDDLPKGRKGLQSDILRRDWGSHRDLSRSKKAQSSTAFSDAESTKSVVRRHSSKSRPADLVFSAIKTSLSASTKTPPLAVQEDNGGTVSCETQRDFDQTTSETHESATLERNKRCLLRNFAAEEPTDNSPRRIAFHHQQNQQRKLTKDSGYEASVCSEPDYVNAMFLCGNQASMPRRSQPSWDSPMAVSEPLSLPSGSFGRLSCATFDASQVGKEKIENAHSSPGLTMYDTIRSTPELSTCRSSLKLYSSNQAHPLGDSFKEVRCEEKAIASWISEQRRKDCARNTPSKSYEDIYEEVVDRPQRDKHMRSSSDPLVDEKHNWIPGGPDTSDSSTYIDSTSSEMKWGDSYSDLSAFSVRSSNQSSGFESGQSAVPDSGRLSPQSSLDGSAVGSYGERVMCRLPAKEGVAHSAKIHSVERHCSESVLYFGGQLKRAPNKGATVSSSSKVTRPAENGKADKSSLHREDTGGDPGGRPLDPQRRTKLPEHDIKLIQKQAVLSYLRLRQADAASVGTKPAQFGNEPPHTAEKPTPIKASSLLDDTGVPPELPPKMFKSSELLQRAKETNVPPVPPPKTFKLSAQQAAYYPAPPPPVKEKSEKLRRSNDSSLVMAKMIFIPPTPASNEVVPSAENSRRGSSGEADRTVLARSLQNRRKVDDGYGTCLDDEDEPPVVKQQQPSPPPPPPPENITPVVKASPVRLRPDEAEVRAEIQSNNEFEGELRNHLKELNREHELRKFANYISEVDNIATLVVSLSLRIARTTNALNELGCEGVAAYKAQLLQKLEKMESELEEAKRLESNCEKRWASFGAHLATFLKQSDLIERYLHFMKNRGDLVVKQRTIHERQQTPRKP